MFEFSVGANARGTKHFQANREAIVRMDSKPMFVFAGDEWDTNPDFTEMKNFFLGPCRFASCAVLRALRPREEGNLWLRVPFCSGQFQFLSLCVRVFGGLTMCPPRLRQTTSAARWLTA
jgi:hypothetical protein